MELRNAFNALILQRTEQLQRLNRELEQKNTDLNSFAYIASHDLKEPVRGIHHYASFVLEDARDILPSESAGMLRRIQDLALRIGELLTALLHYSSVGRIELAPRRVPLDKLLNEALDQLTETLTSSGAQLRRPESLPVVRCDPILIREVLANLVGNALKYNDKADPWVEVTAEPFAGDSSRVEVCVRDNGIGIKEKHFSDIFVMFRRLHERHKFGGGVGAGLAIVKAILEKHGSEIRVDSTTGEGTAFRFSLEKAAS